MAGKSEDERQAIIDQAVTRGLDSSVQLKPSGVKWLGDVPVHWEVCKLKQKIKINNSTLSESTDPYFEFSYIDIGSVDSGRLSERPQKLQFYASPSRARRIVENGDTIVSTVRTYLKATWFAENISDVICSTGFAVLTPGRDLSPKFVSYVAQSNVFTDQVTADSVGVAYPAISDTRLGSLFLCVPPLDEQAAIVEYLDYINVRVSEYINAKRRLIAVLEEEKEVIINQAVTRGLDSSVRLRPSGVRWLGDVPVHWEVRRLATVSELRVSNVDKHSKEGEASVRLCNYVDVYKNDRIASVMPFMTATASMDEIEKFRLNKDDVLITKDSEIWEDIGVPAWVTESADDLLSGYHLAILRPDKEILGSYLALACRTKTIALQFSIKANGVTRYGLARSDIRSVRIPLPPLPEQRAVVSYVAESTSNIDSTITRARRQIELLQEYRTRLIADVVTGKLDVREAVAQLTEDGDEVELIEDDLNREDQDPVAHDVDLSGIV